MIRAAIVNEHPIIRWGIERALEAATDIGIVASVATPDRLVVRADVLILAHDLPSTELVVAMAARANVLVISGLHPAAVEANLCSGARGHICMTSEADVIIDAVRSVAAGGIVRPLATDRESTRPAPPLSPRESQVLQLIGIGYTHGQVASRLGVSRHTIDTYVKRVRGKLGVGNKASMARAALLGGVGAALSVGTDCCAAAAVSRTCTRSPRSA